MSALASVMGLICMAIVGMGLPTQGSRIARWRVGVSGVVGLIGVLMLIAITLRMPTP